MSDAPRPRAYPQEESSMKQVKKSVFAALSALLLALFVSGAATAADYANPSLLVETDELATLLNDKDVRIVDVRSLDAYRKGHIPGAVHLEWKQLVAKDGRFKTLKQLRALFAKHGIVRGKTLVPY